MLDIGKISPSPIISVLLTPSTLNLNKSHTHLPHLIVSTTDGITVLYNVIEKRSIGQYNASGGGSILATHIARLKSNAENQSDDEYTYVLAAVGADRYLHVWDLESRKALSKIWLKTRGTGVGILPSHAGLLEDDMIVAVPKEKRNGTSKNGDIENGDISEDDLDDGVDVWNDMQDANEITSGDTIQVSDEDAKMQATTVEEEMTKKRSDGGASSTVQKAKRLKT